jgi:hypothetical protein
MILFLVLLFFLSKTDYLDFEAILYMPKPSSSDRKPPLVLFPHGKNTVFFCYTWTDNTLFCMSRQFSLYAFILISRVSKPHLNR